MKNDIIIVDGFYKNPYKVREFAIQDLKNHSYCPYDGPGQWVATQFKEWNACPFKSSESLISALNEITSEEVDLDFWKLSYPKHGSQEDKERVVKSCKWNCTFHFKPTKPYVFGNGVHNHVTDIWNGVGREGWVGLIYLNPKAPNDSGLHLWENKDPSRNFDWMTPAENWKLIDSFGAVFNRLILTRGEKPHSGSNGFSPLIEEGRVYQTFFFKTKKMRSFSPVSISVGLKTA